MPIDAAIARLQKEVTERTVRQIVTTEFSGFEGDGEEQHEY